MGARFFISEEALDGLVGRDAASLDGEVLSIPERRLVASVQPAAYFLREVEGKPDPNEWVGKVKTLEALAARGADHFRASVMLGDAAYDVVEGYLGVAPDGWTWPDGAAPAPAAEEIPVELDEPAEEPPAAEIRGSRRPSVGPEALARLEAKPGFRAPGPPPRQTPMAGTTAQRPSRPPPGLSRLPAASSPGPARGSKPPPPPSQRRSAPPAAPPAAPPDGRPSRPPPSDGASPARNADELERILLETIRPSRRKRRT